MMITGGQASPQGQGTVTLYLINTAWVAGSPWKDDPFATWNNVKTGYMILNIRGGCLYLNDYLD